MGLGKYLTLIAPYLFYSVGIIAILASLFKIEWGILFLIPILPLDTVLYKMHAFPLGKDLVDIILIALIIGWFSRALFNKETLVESSALNILIFFLIIYSLFSLYNGQDYLRDYSLFDMNNPRLQTWKNYMILPLIYLVVLNNIRDKKHMKWLVSFMIAVIFLMGFKFYRNFRLVDKSLFIDTMREHGTFSYLGPNEYAAFFSHYIFIVLGLLLLIKSKLKRIFLFLTTSFSLYCIVFLFSRGSYLATYFAFAMAGFLRRNLVILILVAALFISWHIWLPPAVVERINMTTNENNELDNSAEMRLKVWKSSMELFNSNRLVGVGFNTFPYLGLPLGDAHNLYVKILVEQGIIGFIIFLMIILTALYYGWKLYRRARDDLFKGLGLGFFLCTISLLISNFFGDRWIYVPLGAYYWAFMALVVRANIINQKEIQNKNMNAKKKVPA